MSINCNLTTIRKTRMIRSTANANAIGIGNEFPINSAIQQQSEENVNLKREISEIMRGFGDCERPLSESVQLVEKILQQQLRGILFDASDIAMQRRGATFPIQNDFEFMMRLHPVKINRMRKHIKDMRRFRRILQMQYGRPLDEDPQDTDDDLEIEVPEIFDEEKTRRLFRADRISQILSGQQYEQYNEARRTSFYGRKSDVMKQNFKNFLGFPQESKIPNTCLNILAYLAHETIATIVDYAILTRLNSENRIREPYSRVTSSGANYTMLRLCADVTQGRGLDGIKPITVSEIQEAMRRHTQLASKKYGTMGFYRNNLNSEVRKNYLVI